MRTATFMRGLSALVAAATVTGAANAAPGRTNPCTLVTPAKIATVAGLSSSCKKSPATQAPGATLYTGRWPGKAATAPHLQLTVAVYTDTTALQIATRNLKQGLPGAPHKVAGIGAAAYAGAGANAAGVHFLLGNRIAYLTLTAPPGSPQPSTAAVEGLAKSIALLLA